MSQGSAGGVTIIIPAYNEEKGFGEPFGALMASARERGWEVIVVDDGSTDATAALAGSGGRASCAIPKTRDTARRSRRGSGMLRTISSS